MPIEIAELTTEQLPAVRQLCESIDPQGSPVTHPDLALAARDGNTLVGVLLCERNAAGVPTHRVILSPDHQNTGLIHNLLNRAMAKLQGKGVHKYRIESEVSHQEESSPLWHALLWGEQPNLEGATNVVRVMGRY